LETLQKSPIEAPTKKRRRGRPSPDEARALEEDLLAAGMRLFCQNGYSGTSMEAIALSAGIGKKALYARYPNKQTLFSAVVDHLHATQSWVDDEIREDDENTSLEEGLRRRAEAVLSASSAAESVAFYRLLQSEGQRFPELGIIFTTTLSRTIGDFTEYFKRQVAKGRIEEAEPATISVMFVFAIFGDLSNRILFQTTLPSASELKVYAKNVSRLFARALSPGLQGKLPGLAAFVPPTFKSATHKRL
jgi:TetR/AcrR family transcriptional repressor of mexJK operon